MISFQQIQDQIFTIENSSGNSSVTYEKNQYNKIKYIEFVKDYYDYNKPHRQSKTNHEPSWRLITCMFGVIVCKCNEYDFELSRVNKKQLLIGPDIKFNYYNKSGKSVCHIRSSQ